MTRCFHGLTNEMGRNIIREQFGEREETDMKNPMFRANNKAFVLLQNVAAAVSSCHFYNLTAAHAVLTVCAVFFAAQGAVISTSICAAIIPAILIPQIIIGMMIIGMIRIICQLHTVLSEPAPM